MKVLIIASMFPASVTKVLFKTDITDRAGWINSTVQYLKSVPEVELHYLVPKKAEQMLQTERFIDSVSYCQFAYHSPEDIKPYFMNHQFDVIHVFGSEYAYIKDIYPFLPINRTLFYIQGLIEPYYKEYLAGLDQFQEMDPITMAVITYTAKLFRRRGEGEKLVYPHAKHVAGRTAWDKDYVDTVNHNYTYHYLSESLRDAFYEGTVWNRNDCIPHTIFMSQGNYPIKGLHMALRIVKQVKTQFPDVLLKVGGPNLYTETSLATKLGISYVSFIRRLIRKYKLEENVQFLGMLDEKQVKEQLLKANVFLSPSSIENSPNSLQEAMLTGTPCISSDVGGVRSIVPETEQCILYSFEDTERAADEICRLFEDPGLQDRLSKNGRVRALVTTDRKNNGATLLKIYREMCCESEGCGTE